jgi:glycosyltransferase involved in cell wall biosynthesis
MSGVLFVHNNFPAQFGFVATELIRRGEKVAAICSPTGRAIDGVELRRWETSRESAKGVYRPAQWLEMDLIRARAAYDCAISLRDSGFDPDVIVAHPFMGGSLFLKEAFPRARQIAHAEFYYSPHGSDADFDSEFAVRDEENRFKIRAYNATLAMAYAEADAIVAPTPYQRALLPPALAERALVIHEGIDTEEARPASDPWLAMSSGQRLTRGTPVITYASRRFEPLRGVHILLRALPRVLEAVPDAHVLMIGADDPEVYGLRAPSGTTWKQYFLKELGDRLDPARVHFTGVLSRPLLMTALSLSRAHVYYTYPFVLSWSVLEAMACEGLVIGSDTAPLRDAITSGQDGLLLDFFDVEALSDALIQACREPERFSAMRRAARQTILERFDRARLCLPAWIELIERMRA